MEVLLLVIFILGCEKKEEPEMTDFQRATASLTEKTVSENFIFHYQPGDGYRAEIDRSEAFHKWAVSYLDIKPPKKIDFYMFPTFEEMWDAFSEITGGLQFGGRAFPIEFAVATGYSWHNHECFHLYISPIGDPPRIFNEGMVVAHEFDPYNNVWISQWNRIEPYHEPYTKIAFDYKNNGLLYPIDSLLESADFIKRTQKVAYIQSGTWIMYLIDTYGLDKMKHIIASIPYNASIEKIQTTFLETYDITPAESEPEWLDWLDEQNQK